MLHVRCSWAFCSPVGCAGGGKRSVHVWAAHRPTQWPWPRLRVQPGLQAKLTRLAGPWCMGSLHLTHLNRQARHVQQAGCFPPVALVGAGIGHHSDTASWARQSGRYFGYCGTGALH